jgi:hypothetical protein
MDDWETALRNQPADALKYGMDGFFVCGFAMTAQWMNVQWRHVIIVDPGEGSLNFGVKCPCAGWTTLGSFLV